tara:strand:- start:33 stop:1916 length:1884 start_codon:yes stop_codon:yes gene_type:complete
MLAPTAAATASPDVTVLHEAPAAATVLFLKPTFNATMALIQRINDSPAQIDSSSVPPSVPPSSLDSSHVASLESCESRLRSLRALAVSIAHFLKGRMADCVSDEFPTAPGVISHLVQLLKRGTCHDAGLVSMSLFELVAAAPEHLDALLAVDGVPVLVTMLKHVPVVKSQLPSANRQLRTCRREAASAVTVRPAASDEAKVSRCAIILLAGIGALLQHRSDAHDKLAAIFVDQEGIALLHSLMTHSSPDIRTIAVSTLGNLAMNRIDCQDALCQKGAIAALVRVFKTTPREEDLKLHGQVFGALRNIAANHAIAKAAMVAEHAVQLMVDEVEGAVGDIRNGHLTRTLRFALLPLVNVASDKASGAIILNRTSTVEALLLIIRLGRAHGGACDAAEILRRCLRAGVAGSRVLEALRVLSVDEFDALRGFEELHALVRSAVEEEVERKSEAVSDRSVARCDVASLSSLIDTARMLHFDTAKLSTWGSVLAQARDVLRQHTERVRLGIDGIETPHEYKCPLSLAIMRDPVVASDGHSYERYFIEAVLKTRRRDSTTGKMLKPRSPITRQVLGSSLFPNRALLRRIEAHDEDMIEAATVALAASNASSARGAKKRERTAQLQAAVKTARHA